MQTPMNLRRPLRVVVIAGAVLVGALTATGAAYAATSGDGSGGSAGEGFAVVDRSSASGPGLVPAQGGTGADCPRENGATPQPSGAADQL